MYLYVTALGRFSGKLEPSVRICSQKGDFLLTFWEQAPKAGSSLGNQQSYGGLNWRGEGCLSAIGIPSLQRVPVNIPQLELLVIKTH